MLIEGESGSGKELVAASLHSQSPRAGKPYLALNCAAISPNLVEATLFGYAKGAFTGASATRPGYFEDAKDGTLFLDEIGELPLELQPKLLRVLENGAYQRVGETTTRASQARVLAATNRDLKLEVRSGRFRADLYHRLERIHCRRAAAARSGRRQAPLAAALSRTFMAAKARARPLPSRTTPSASGWSTLSPATCASCEIS